MEDSIRLALRAAELRGTKSDTAYSEEAAREGDANVVAKLCKSMKSDARARKGAIDRSRDWSPSAKRPRRKLQVPVAEQGSGTGSRRDLKQSHSC